ncbi:hypothetical protein [Trichormus sp. NMC-1]|uniref:hypothetical protein n=1 Tax=Trichormus sp. NMC-1 TaxID=1853259 RepID=UPI0015A588EC|nr:hypothetical protein [Trichormus sp. NMC-1]
MGLKLLDDLLKFLSSQLAIELPNTTQESIPSQIFYNPAERDRKFFTGCSK